MRKREKERKREREKESERVRESERKREKERKRMKEKYLMMDQKLSKLSFHDHMSKSFNYCQIVRCWQTLEAIVSKTIIKRAKSRSAIKNERLG